MAFPFEKSGKDKEPRRGMREGSRKEEKMDAMQMMKKSAKGKGGKKAPGKKC